MAPLNKSSPTSDSQNSDTSEISVSKNSGSSDSQSSGSKSELAMQEMTGSMSRLSLNPLAREFFPASHRGNQMVANGFSWRRPNDNQGRRSLGGRAYRDQRDDSIKRTVYVSDVDHEVSEEELASVFFGRCGHVVDCRICGDPKSQLRFAFVEFANIYGAKVALELTGTVVGLYPIRVSPSKTAILPVNPEFLPKSEEELSLVARTVYCTNIDSMVSEADVWLFFEQFCGQVTRMRLLGDPMQSSHRAFVEFAMTDSAVAALNFSGSILGALPIRVSPSKTPVRDPPS